MTGATAVEAFGRRFRFDGGRILTPERRRAFRHGIGARTDRAWTVPAAAVIALPHGTIGIAMLVGVILLLRDSRFTPPRRSSRAQYSAQPTGISRVTAALRAGGCGLKRLTTLST